MPIVQKIDDCAVVVFWFIVEKPLMSNLNIWSLTLALVANVM